MGDGLKRITRRIKRLFVAEEEQKAAPRMGASQVIAPEQVVMSESAVLRRHTTRLAKPVPPDATFRIDVLPWGVTHVQFIRLVVPTVVDARDPITRRLDRRTLFDGMKTQTTYYNKNGELVGDGTFGQT